MSTEQSRAEHLASISGPTDLSEADMEAMLADAKDADVRADDWRREPERAAAEAEEAVEVAQERERTAAAEQQANQLAAQNQQLAEQQMLLQAEANRRANPPPPPVHVPPVEHDPVGHIVGRLEQQNRAVAELGRWAMQQENQGRVAAAQQQVAGVVNHVLNTERDFASKNPDYNDSAQFLIDHRDRELETAGILDATQRQNILRDEAAQLAARAYQSNKNPAEMVYQLAKARGFDSSGSRGDLPAGMTARRLVGMSDREFSRYDKGVGPGGALTTEKLLSMGDDAFARALETREGRDLLGR